MRSGRAERLTAAVAVAATSLAICPVVAAQAAPRGHRHAIRPRAFASCTQLVRYARSHFAVTHGVPDPAVRPFSAPVTAGPPQTSSGTATPAPAASGTDTGAGSSFSTTNDQEPGVDEPDTVKTDGHTIYSVSQGRLYAVAATGSGAPRLDGSLALGSSSFGDQLLLRGGRLIVISGGGPIPVDGGVARPAAAAQAPAGGGTALIAPLPGIEPSPYYYRGVTSITEIDVHNPAAMHVTRTMTVDGTFVDARQVGGSARLVFSSPPPAIAQPLLRARAAGWIPARSFHSRLSGRHYRRAVASCSQVSRPADFSGVGMLTILTVDLDRGLYAADSEALMADAEVVYGSQHSLYVATQRWLDPRLDVDALPTSDSTVIDRFDTSDPLRTTLTASGEVPGYVLNQFSMSEQRGDLRVATTSRPIWWGVEPPRTVSQSYVTVLSARAGSLVPVGRVSGLGAGQQIYSVRFVGDAGYVVTFRRVDPLYVLDLADPAAPRITGQLELEGYSSYLHPLGAGMLLGVGQAVGAGNEPSATQVELLDVSKPSAPRLVGRLTYGDGSSSEVAYDHHAFLWWPPAHLAVLPLQIYSVGPGGPPQPGGASIRPSRSFTGAIGLLADGSGLREAARVSQDPVDGASQPITRSLVVGSRLYTVSDGGIMASDLGTLAREGFVALAP